MNQPLGLLPVIISDTFTFIYLLRNQNSQSHCSTRNNKMLDYNIGENNNECMYSLWQIFKTC